MTWIKAYCHHRNSTTGAICSLYKDHYNKHKENHGKSYWTDEEGEYPDDRA